ncbi:MAG: heparinase II/III domain-containing protein [Sphingobacteriaceae bacterium]
MAGNYYINCILLFLVLSFVRVEDATASRIYGGFYTAERILNLRNNCGKYDWAKKQRALVLQRAKPWLAKGDEELWAMIPNQDLPRCIDVTFDRLTTGPKFLGCLKCGHKISKYGNYPYNPDFKNKPWKLTCPSCSSVFPTNDFYKYYLSAIDERGLFNPAKGDKSLLFNVNHPDPNDPLHKYGVDDGYGYVNENGRSFRFVGYYTWKYWDHIIEGLGVLADGYLYTGEPIYARKAAIMLDRIADVYPDMDWKTYADKGWYHSDGGEGLGKIEGSIWETTVVQQFADSYDKILSGTVNNPALYQFLHQQSQKYTLPGAKGTRDQFVKNVDDGILRTAFKAVLSQQIRGNQGMHQLSVAKCAIALNTHPETTQWLDWLFKSDGGAIPELMVSNFDRDGTSDEGAPSYAYMWGHLVAELGELLASYSGYTKHNIFREFPQFSVTFIAAYRMAALGIAIPNIGDSGSTGLVSAGMVNPNFIAKGYLFTRDEEMAIAAYRANGNSSSNLGRNIYSKDPEALSEEIKRVAENADKQPEGGRILSGFGLAFLEAGRGSNGYSIALNYGRTMKHAHPDLLNFDLLAFGKWLAPDHGYPEYATKWPSNNEWTGSTLSHNLVYVNRKPQREVWGGYTRMFKQLKGFGVVELDGLKAYPGLKTYNRTMLLVGGTDNSEDNNAYVIDIFNVNGGFDHVYSFHGPPGLLTTNGLKLETQAKGTYAGEAVEKGTLARHFPVGYSHLYNVRRDKKPPEQFILDWKAETGYHGLKDSDDVHLRMHGLSKADDIALADGDPPQNKPGNPKTLGYVLLHKAGENLRSTFVSVFEPYKKDPFIKSVKRLDNGNGDNVSIKVEHFNGNIDYIVYNQSDKSLKLSNGITMDGKLGYIRVKQGKAARAFLVNGSEFKYSKMHLKADGMITGKVLKMNKQFEGGGWILVDTVLPIDESLIGEQIMIATNSERDASYTIKKIEREGSLTRVYCGPITFVRDIKKKQDGGSDEKATSKFLYDFEEGASFQITSHKEWVSK